MAVRFEHAGAAAATALSSSITNVTTALNVASATGWPTGAVGPFVITVDAGTAGEEKILVSSRTGLVLTVQTRGYDSTTATSHAFNAAVIHSFSATEADEANVAAVAVTGVSALGAAWTSYAPGWGSTGANPTIGNGTIVGIFKQAGKTCHFSVTIITGSTTTAGTGTYFILLPVASVTVAGLQQAVSVYYVSTVEMSGAGRITSGSSNVGAISVNDAGWVAGIPAMPTGTVIVISGTYQTV